MWAYVPLSVVNKKGSKALASDSKERDGTPHYEPDQSMGRGAFEERISGTILKYSRRKKSQWPSSHHWEASKKCSKLLPSPGFEPRPFVVSVPRYVRYRIDKVCLLSGNGPVQDVARKRRVTRGMSTHFCQHRSRIEQKFGDDAASTLQSRRIEPGSNHDI